jgi:hypothetical protein
VTFLVWTTNPRRAQAWINSLTGKSFLRGLLFLIVSYASRGMKFGTAGSPALNGRCIRVSNSEKTRAVGEYLNLICERCAISATRHPS